MSRGEIVGGEPTQLGAFAAAQAHGVADSAFRADGLAASVATQEGFPIGVVDTVDDFGHLLFEPLLQGFVEIVPRLGSEKATEVFAGLDHHGVAVQKFMMYLAIYGESGWLVALDGQFYLGMGGEH